MNRDWQAVPMPEGIAKRPRDARGFPITFVTLIDSNGRPDFSTVDGQRIVECITKDLCGLCGEALPGTVAFVGGPLSCENRNFLDPPMHVACAEYAMKVCPHITIPTSRYKKQELGGPEQREVFQDVSDERPEKFGLFITNNYGVYPYNGQPVFISEEPIQLLWQEELT